MGLKFLRIGAILWRVILTRSVLLSIVSTALKICAGTPSATKASLNALVRLIWLSLLNRGELLLEGLLQTTAVESFLEAEQVSARDGLSSDVWILQVIF